MAETEAAGRYFDAVARADLAEATKVVMALLDEGVPVGSVVDEVLVDAQRRVGSLWQRGDWSVADEHAATAVTDAVLGLLMANLAPPAAASGRRVALACGEGEWHDLPARLAAASATHAGADVVFLGPSVPARDLARRLRADPVDVVALSCTLPSNLVRLTRSVVVAHEAGIPVVVGGRAFAGSVQRATAVGAEALLTSASDLAGPVPALREGSEAVVPAEALWLDTVGDGVLADAFGRVADAFPQAAVADDRARRRTREDLRWITRFAGAAVLTGDATVLTELLAWLRVVLHPAVPSGVLAGSLALLAETLEPDAPTAAAMLRAAVRAAEDPPPA